MPAPGAGAPSTYMASNIERNLKNDREVLLSGVRANHVDLKFELRDSVGHGL